MKDSKKKKNVPSQGTRKPRDRRGGGIVPATPVSSSDEGPPTLLPASKVGALAIAEEETRGCKRQPSCSGVVPAPKKGSGSGSSLGLFPKGFLGKPPLREQQPVKGKGEGKGALAPTTPKLGGSTPYKGWPTVSDMLATLNRPAESPEDEDEEDDEDDDDDYDDFVEDPAGESKEELLERCQVLQEELGRKERWACDLSQELGLLREGALCPRCSRECPVLREGTGLSVAGLAAKMAPTKRCGTEASAQTEPVSPPPPPAFDPDEFIERVGAVLDARVAALREELLPKLSARATGVTPPPEAVKGIAALDPDVFFERVGALMDGRMAALREELLAKMAAKAEGATPPAPTGKRRGGRKKGRVKAPPETAASAQKGSGPRASAVEPSAPSSPAGEQWSRVVGRRAARGAAKPPAATPSAQGRKSDGGAGRNKTAPPKKTKKARARVGRLPAFAAVTVTVEAGSGETLASAMHRSKREINLADLGIAELRPRRAINGGLLLGVPGADSAARADALAAKMKVALEGTGVRIGRPAKYAELRVCGLVDGATSEGVRAALAAAGECPEGDVRVNQIRTDPSGLGTVWARCPLAAARKIAIARVVRVGWMAAPVTILGQRPLRCYRCLHVGHVGQRCSSRVDRGDRCYRCGAPGHSAGVCLAAEPNCPLCADLGRPAGHRLGGAGCAPRPPSTGRSGAGKGLMPQPSDGTGAAKPAVRKRPAAVAAAVASTSSAKLAAVPRVRLTRICAGRSRGEGMDTS